MARKKSQESLSRWSKQDWTTASGKRSQDTGEVYAPKATIESLRGSAKLASANEIKRRAKKAGEQYAKHGLHRGKKR